MGNVIMALPLSYNLPTRWFFNWVNMDKTQCIGIAAVEHVWLPRAMQMMVNMAFDRYGDDWTWFTVLEHDVMPPLNAFSRVSGYPDDLDVVGGLTFRHEPPHTPYVYMPMEHAADVQCYDCGKSLMDEDIRHALRPDRDSSHSYALMLCTEHYRARAGCDPVCAKRYGGRDKQAREQSCILPPSHKGLHKSKEGTRWRAAVSKFDEAVGIITAGDVHNMVQTPGLYPCAAVGFGFASIHRRVLEKWDPEIPMFECSGPWGSQDMWFCAKAREQGFSVWVDTELCCGHLTLTPIGYEDNQRLAPAFTDTDDSG